MSALTQKEKDIQMMLASGVHLGTKNVNHYMSPYVWKRKPDGIHLLNIGTTYDKLKLAARVLVTIENPEDICIVASRTYAQRPSFKFSQHTGAFAITGQFTPGRFTNHIHRTTYREPRILLVADPRADHQAITEATYANIPVIAFCDTDSPIEGVDIVIPCNNKGRLAIGLLFWLLARELLTMRGTVNAANPWTEIVDLFFYRDPDEIEKPKDTTGPTDDWTGGAAGENVTDWSEPAAGGDWSAEPAGAPLADWGATPAPSTAPGWQSAAEPTSAAAGWDTAAPGWGN
jgi:small subunit ribosomal protein SAe